MQSLDVDVGVHRFWIFLHSVQIAKRVCLTRRDMHPVHRYKVKVTFM